MAAAEPFGFRPGGVFPAFGMAETAIGAAFPRRLTGLVCDTVDREVLERSRRRQADRRQRPRRAGRQSRVASRCSAPPCPGWRCASSTPVTSRGTARAPRRRAAAARHVGDARLLQARGGDGGAVPRRLAVHRRPGLPARRAARAVRADQGRHHRRRSQRLPGGHRACRRRARRCARRQRDRVRHGGLQGQGVGRRRRRGARRRPRRRCATRSTTARSRCVGCRRAT